LSASAAIAAAGDPAGYVEVVGAGTLAAEVRQLLGERIRPTGDTRPTVIIETTGELSMLTAALLRVDDLGTVVLAGPVPQVPPAMDLYGEFHVRGLTIIGVPHDSAPD
jgi:threonine dehydrogenase-like Zn-dependent dehydrogenase